MKKVLKWIAGLLVLAIIMWWVWSFFKPKDAVSYLTEEVKRGNISQTVSATGEIASSHLVEVGAQASGQIRKLHVKLGQKIKQGDLIAEIDSRSQTNTLNTNRSQLETYRAKLASAYSSENAASMVAILPPWPFRNRIFSKPCPASERTQSPIAAIKVEGRREMVPGKPR